jgi:uncharacterized membrane protein YkvA (DUF1232 family)
MGRLRDWARRLKAETLALYLAARDPRTPWYARAFIAFVVAYALSPIDLIPDFVPVLGLLDEIILIPIGIALALRMVPGHVMTEARERAHADLSQQRPRSRAAAVVIVAIWLGAAALTGVLGYRTLG